jgi:hypothetical protein
MNVPGMEQLFDRVEDASFLNIDGDTPVTTPELYLAWHTRHVMARRIAKIWQVDGKPLARIEHNRWVVDCVACSTSLEKRAAFTHPEWRIACCGECGAIYRDVQFPNPAVRKALERLLLFRPRANRNWFPGESLADITMENRKHKVAC